VDILPSLCYGAVQGSIGAEALFRAISDSQGCAPFPGRDVRNRSFVEHPVEHSQSRETRVSRKNSHNSHNSQKPHDRRPIPVLTILLPNLTSLLNLHASNYFRPTFSEKRNNLPQPGLLTHELFTHSQSSQSPLRGAILWNNSKPAKRTFYRTIRRTCPFHPPKPATPRQTGLKSFSSPLAKFAKFPPAAQKS
jgi:hypothetical protein